MCPESAEDAFQGEKGQSHDPRGSRSRDEVGPQAPEELPGVGAALSPALGAREVPVPSPWGHLPPYLSNSESEVCIAPNLPIPSLLPFYSGEGKAQRKNFCFRLIYREASNFINSFDTTSFLSLLPTPSSSCPPPKNMRLKRRLNICPAGRFLPRWTRVFAANVVHSKGTRKPAAPGDPKLFLSGCAWSTWTKKTHRCVSGLPQ